MLLLLQLLRVLQEPRRVQWSLLLQAPCAVLVQAQPLALVPLALRQRVLVVLVMQD